MVPLSNNNVIIIVVVVVYATSSRRRPDKTGKEEACARRFDHFFSFTIDKSLAGVVVIISEDCHALQCMAEDLHACACRCTCVCMRENEHVYVCACV
jgi:hypothetical protein